MTNYGSVSRKCHKCKKTTKVTVLCSTNSFGSPDLDARPAPMERDTMIAWIEQCEHCGYCAKNLEKENDIDPSFVASETYQAVLKDEQYPRLARTFLAAALCNERLELFDLAAINYRNAAWVCDDNVDIHSPQSKACREKFLGAMEKAVAKGSTVMDEPHADNLLKIDALRRIEKFERATEVAKKTLEIKDVSDFFKKICSLQIKLCERKDSDVHQMSEVDES